MINMVVPLIPLALGGLLAGGTIGNLASSLYQQNNYRNYTNTVNQQYRQWISDYQKNTGRSIRYDKLPSNASGMIYQNENVGIPNSYAQSWGSGFSAMKSMGAIGLGYFGMKGRVNPYRYNTTFRGAKRWV